MKCYECKWLDRSVILTSNPPQYGCTLGFGSHYADHECEYDFMPIVRCKDCRHSDTTGVYVEDVVYCKWLHTSCVKNGYCHRGERKGGDTE